MAYAADALPLYRRLKNTPGASCLFESASTVDKSSRMSLIGIEPSLELTGKDDQLVVRLLHDRAGKFYEFIKTAFAGAITNEQNGRLELRLPKQQFEGPEDGRFDRPNIAQPLRRLLASFRTSEKNFTGFYGAFSYRFVYLFEDIAFGDKPCAEPDFHLFLFDNILLFNHLTQDLTLYVTRDSKDAAEKDAAAIVLRAVSAAVPEHMPFEAGEVSTTPDDATFLRQVGHGVQLCNEGELLEIVLSRQLSTPVKGDALNLYARYRAVNPSPYLFFFDFSNETLLGASPELMLRYEGGRATLRPISGSVRRSSNPIEDHQLMMELLNSPKENSELDMLIDLGRNDLARICKPGIEIEHYRIVEKYSHVTHTVAQLSGVPEERYSGFDALIASLNAGTLTGAPKVAAMNQIEQIERHTRGYYGGCIGWLLLDGDVNTAITIRSAHIRDNVMTYSTGATLLYESVPENELRETQVKAAAFLTALKSFQPTKAVMTQ